MEYNNQQTTSNITSTLSRLAQSKSEEIDKKQVTNSTKTLKRLKTLNKGNNNNNKTIKKVNTKRLSRFTNTLKKYNFKESVARTEKINLNQKGVIEIAQQHSLSNRPLQKLKDPDSKDQNDIKYCRCCGLPCATPGIYEPFKMCDDTDKYFVLGEAISLYFSFYKFCIFILFVALCVLMFPSFYVINAYYSSLSNMCEIVKDKNFKICANFIKDKNILKNNTKQSTITFQSQLNAANLNSYIDFYNTLMEYHVNDTTKFSKKYGKIMNKMVINNSISYFIVLLSLFIINLLYIIFQNNTILYYNYKVISPSDYAIIISNMAEVRKAFRKMKYNYIKNKNLNPKEFRKNLGFTGEDLTNKNITDATEFSAYIKKYVINKYENYNVETVNICYKLKKYTKLKEDADKYNEYLFDLDNNQIQIKRNRQLKLNGNRRIYFESLIPEILENTLDFFGCKFDFCGKKYKIMDILLKRRHKEKELDRLLEEANNIREKNFANVVFISFSTISEQEKFLENNLKNLIMKIIIFFKNFKYIFCSCFLDKKSKSSQNVEIDEILDIYPASEPDDILFENLETKKLNRYFLVVFSSFISFLIIIISFIIVVSLTMIQEKINKLSFGEKNFSKYAVSLAMTGIISIVNIILEIILEKLTKKETHISLTNFNLSFSVKLSICTFVNSAIVPLISNIFANTEKYKINQELLVSNMLMMFAVNSVVSPLMWTFNIGFYLNKLIIWKLERKKNIDMNQKKLNELYEFMDINLAYKYSYLSKTLLMTFFYLPLFPLGIAFSMFGFILGFYLEKFNMGHRYKRPEMMNKTICKFYTNFFEVNFLMLALGDYIFLKNKYVINYWCYINLAIFFLLLVLPYGHYLKFNFLGINQSNINKQTYNDSYFMFFNDYELINPFTIKKGRINYLEKLKNINFFSEAEFLAKKQRIEKTSFYKIISEAKPTRGGFKPSLLSNINLEDSNTKAKRLFQLIKKLYHSSDEYLEHEICTKSSNNINFENKRTFNIPNILHLAGTIFGLEEENEPLKSLKEKGSEESKDNEETMVDKSKVRKSKTFLINDDHFKNKLSRNKPSFVIKAQEKNKDFIINQNTSSKYLESNINTQNSLINNNLNSNRNETNSETNAIIDAIKNEINTGKKDFIHYSDWCKEKKKENKNDFEVIERSKKKLKSFNSTNFNSNHNINTNNSKGNISYVSNISVTINQFFNKSKDNQNTSPNNMLKCNNTIIENEQEDKKTNTRYKLSSKKVFPSIKDEGTFPENDSRPINNIINIVVNNDNNNMNNIKNKDNNDNVVLNEYINVK